MFKAITLAWMLAAIACAAASGCSAAPGEGSTDGVSEVDSTGANLSQTQAAGSCEITSYDVCSKRSVRAYNQCMLGKAACGPAGHVNEPCCRAYADDVFYICCYP
jgi:hypothetical protein